VGGSFRFIFSADYLEYVQNHPGDYELVFAGITTAFDPASIGAVGILALVGGIVVAVVGHIVVLALGVLRRHSGGASQYVEFFGNFYEGGGDAYLPFGYDRRYTSDE